MAGRSGLVVLLVLAGFALRDRVFLSPAMPGHLHARPAVWTIRDVPDSPCRADHRVRDGKAQPRSAGLAGGPVETVEEPLAFRLRDAGTVVLDRDADTRAR